MYPLVTLKTNQGEIKLELYPSYAPNTVNNFISLVKKGFYNGIIFHRVIADFMIQGGDPQGIGIGGPGYSIKGEFISNGFKINTLRHERGVISMARASAPNSAGSQFFIMHKDGFFLDGQYAAFGRVIEGIEVVDKIAATATDYRDKPLEEQKIISATVDTFGETYPEPEKY
ncbi:MAG: peptidylprolyl isomerase [Clostridia bacterium]|nr:peptidylprolyl isomerase [Clostridia bacterium]